MSTEFESIVTGFDEDRDYTGAYLNIKKAKMVEVLTALLVLTWVGCAIPLIVMLWKVAL